VSRAAALLVLALALPAAGCAPMNEPQPSAPPPASPVATPAAPAGAARDSSPSPEALAVLATIPEPLGTTPAGGVRTLPEARAPQAAASADSTAPRDSSAVETSPVDTASVPVPVPARTTPLGEAGTAQPAAPPPPLPAPPPPATPSPRVAPDTCWRVQLGAPAERAKGTALRTASQSLLMVPMSVVHEGARWKVRTRDCLDRAAAESLRARALASGFRGVFLVRAPQGTR